MRLPPPSRCVHIALLFVSHFFLGTFVAVWGTYQYQQSRWLASLSREQGKQLLSLRETLLAAQTPARSTPDSVARDLAHLNALRSRATQQAQPILELRIASDRALLARLDRNENNPAAAAQSDAARSLLRELGWRDTSDATLGALAEQRMQTIDSRNVR
jgi:hypothetical protein